MRGGLRLVLLLASSHAGACDSGALSAADAGDGSDAALDPRYAEVKAIFEHSCAYVRCHSGPLVGGALDLSRGGDPWAALVSVPACEYERMSRVEPGKPEASWLMVKLTARFRDAGDPYPNYIVFTPPSDWDPSARGCRDEAADGTPLFGQRMPATAPNTLSERALETIEAWIEAGAPH